MEVKIRVKCYNCGGVRAGCSCCSDGLVEKWLKLSKLSEWMKTDERGDYPCWHPEHSCGMFCDGQDGSNSQCSRQKQGWHSAWAGRSAPHKCEQNAHFMKGYNAALKFGARVRHG
jgi:hypothetical protein